MKIRNFSWVLFVLILASNSFVLAQTKIPKQRYLKINKDPYNKTFSDGIFCVYGGCSFMSFLNTNYSKKVNDKIISPNLGVFLGIYQNAGPLTLDVRYVLNKFEINKPVTGVFEADKDNPASAKLNGSDISISWNLLPAKKFFNFFIAAGYSFYQMSFKGKKEKDQTVNEVQHMSQPFWTSGLEIHFGRLTIRGEYQQTLIFKNQKYPYNRLSFGIAWST